MQYMYFGILVSSEHVSSTKLRANPFRSPITLYDVDDMENLEGAKKRSTRQWGDIFIHVFIQSINSSQ